MADAEAKRLESLEAGRKALLKRQKKKASANASLVSRDSDAALSSASTSDSEFVDAVDTATEAIQAQRAALEHEKEIELRISEAAAKLQQVATGDVKQQAEDASKVARQRAAALQKVDDVASLDGNSIALITNLEHKLSLEVLMRQGADKMMTELLGATPRNETQIASLVKKMEKSEQNIAMYKEQIDALLSPINPKASKLPKFKALREWRGQKGQLSFMPDDIILNVSRVDDTWLEGLIDGKRGIFPASAAQEIIEYELDGPLTSSTPTPREATNGATGNGEDIERYLARIRELEEEVERLKAALAEKDRQEAVTHQREIDLANSELSLLGRQVQDTLAWQQAMEDSLRGALEAERRRTQELQARLDAWQKAGPSAGEMAGVSDMLQRMARDRQGQLEALLTNTKEVSVSTPNISISSNSGVLTDESVSTPCKSCALLKAQLSQLNDSHSKLLSDHAATIARIHELEALLAAAQAKADQAAVHTASRGGELDLTNVAAASAADAAAADETDEEAQEEAIWDQWVQDVNTLLAREKMQIRTLFARLDASGDNILTRREFAEGMAKHKINLTPSQRAIVLKRLDANHDDKIDLTEFSKMLKVTHKATPLMELKRNTLSTSTTQPPTATSTRTTTTTTTTSRSIANNSGPVPTPAAAAPDPALLGELDALRAQVAELTRARTDADATIQVLQGELEKKNAPVAPATVPAAAAAAAPAETVADLSPDEIVYRRWVNEVCRIVAEDKQRISTVFNRMSKNKDVMTRDEFVAGVGVLPLKEEFTPAELQMLARRVDRDGNNRVTLEEFSQDMKHKHLPLNPLDVKRNPITPIINEPMRRSVAVTDATAGSTAAAAVPSAPEDVAALRDQLKRAQDELAAIGKQLNAANKANTKLESDATAALAAKKKAEADLATAVSARTAAEASAAAAAAAKSKADADLMAAVKGRGRAEKDRDAALESVAAAEAALAPVQAARDKAEEHAREAAAARAAADAERGRVATARDAAEADLAAVRAQLAAMQRERDALAKQGDASSHEWASKLAASEAAVAKLTHQVTQLEDKARDDAGQRSQLNSRLTGLQRQLDEATAQVKAEQEKEKKLIDASTELQKQLDASAAKLKAEQDKEKGLLETQAALQKQLDAANAQIKADKEKEKQLQDTQAALQKQLDDLAAQLKVEKEKEKGLQADKSALQSQLDDLSAQLKAEREKEKNLQGGQAALQKQLDDLAAQLKAEKDKEKSLQADKGALQKQLDDTLAQLKAEQDKEKALQGDKGAVQKQLDDTLAQLKAEQDKRKKQQEAQAALEEQHKTREQELVTSRDTVSQTLKTKEAELAKAQKDLADRDALIAQLRARIAELEKQVADLTTQLAEARKQLEAQVAALKDQVSRAGAADSHSAELQQQLDATKGTLERTQSEFKALREEKATLVETHKRATEQSTAQAASLTAQGEQLRTHVTELEARLKAAEGRADKGAASLSTLQAQLAAAEARAKEAGDAHTSETAALREKMKELEASLHAAQSTAASKDHSSQAMLDDLRAQLKAREDKLQVQGAALKSAQDEIGRATTDAAAARDKHAQDLKEAKAALDQQTALVARLQQELEASRKELAQARTDLQTRIEEITRLTQQITIVRKELDERTNSLATAEARLAATQNELKQHTGTLSDRQRSLDEQAGALLALQQRAEQAEAQLEAVRRDFMDKQAESTELLRLKDAELGEAAAAAEQVQAALQQQQQDRTELEESFMAKQAEATELLRQKDAEAAALAEQWAAQVNDLQQELMQSQAASTELLRTKDAEARETAAQTEQQLQQLSDSITAQRDEWASREGALQQELEDLRQALQRAQSDASDALRLREETAQHAATEQQAVLEDLKATIARLQKERDTLAAQNKELQAALHGERDASGARAGEAAAAVAAVAASQQQLAQLAAELADAQKKLAAATEVAHLQAEQVALLKSQADLARRESLEEIETARMQYLQAQSESAAQIRQAQADAQAARDQRAADAQALGAHIEELQRQVQVQAVALENAQRESENHAATVSRLQARIAQLEADIAVLNEQKSSQQATHTQHLRTIETRRDEVVTTLQQQAQREMAAFQDEIARLKRTVEQLKADKAAVDDEAAAMRQRLREVQQEIARLQKLADDAALVSKMATTDLEMMRSTMQSYAFTPTQVQHLLAGLDGLVQQLPPSDQDQLGDTSFGGYNRKLDALSLYLDGLHQEITRLRQDHEYRAANLRFFLALHSYDPATSSRNPDADAELAFERGNVMAVYGDIDGDGFYEGAVRNRHGLVPSNMVVEFPDTLSGDAIKALMDPSAGTAEIAALQSLVEQLRGQLSTASRTTEQAQLALETAEHRIAVLQKENELLQAQLAKASTDLSAAERASRATMQRELDAVQRRTEEALAALRSDLQSKLDSATRELNEAQQQLARLTAENQSLRDSQRRELEQLQRRVVELQTLLDEATHTAKITQINRQLESAQDQTLQAQRASELAARTKRLSEVESDLAARDSALAAARQTGQAAEALARSLEGLLRSHIVHTHTVTVLLTRVHDQLMASAGDASSGIVLARPEAPSTSAELTQALGSTHSALKAVSEALVRDAAGLPTASTRDRSLGSSEGLDEVLIDLEAVTNTQVSALSQLDGTAQGYAGLVDSAAGPGVMPTTPSRVSPARSRAPVEGLRRVYETLKRNSDALLQTNLGLRRTLEQLSQRKASLLHEVYLEANAIAQLTGRPRLFPALVESRHVPLLAAPAPAPAPLPSTTTFIHTHADTKTVLSTHTEQLTVLVQRLRASAGQDPALLSLLNSILVNLENIRGSLNPASNGTEDVSRLLERNRQLTLDATRTDTRLRELLVKYSRAESMRKALIYQKKYLLLLLGGFQESEEVTLSMIASMGVSPTVAVRPRFLALRAKLRAAIVCAQAATRLRLLVRRRVARHGTR